MGKALHRTTTTCSLHIVGLQSDDPEKILNIFGTPNESESGNIMLSFTLGLLVAFMTFALITLVTYYFHS